MHDGLAALPDSHVRPPQDLKTLATWLYMAYGIVAERKFGIHSTRSAHLPQRRGALPMRDLSWPRLGSTGWNRGLELQPAHFSLTQLREGPETLSQIKRGRPDLAFLKSVPAALLVSTIFWRIGLEISPARFRRGAAGCGAPDRQPGDRRQRPGHHRR